MYRRITKPAFVLMLFLLFSLGAQAQSGRGRRDTPPPKPAPKPNTPMTTVLGVPENGKLVKQDVDNLTGRYGLKNGLTVIVRERHSSPLVSINVTVKAGSIHETDDTAGMARLVERMVLKGTATRNASAIERETARLGGILTSRSAYDHTSYNIIVPAESYQAAVELLAEMFLKPAFNADDLKKAAAEVSLESRRTQGRAPESAIEKLFGAAFNANPVKRGSAVSDAALAAVTREKALEFFQQFYRPRNMVVSVVGDVFSIQALGQVQLQFGNLTVGLPTPEVNKPEPSPAPTKAGTPSKTPTPAPAAQPATRNPQPATLDEPAQDKLRYANARADLGQTLVAIGYRTPAIKNDKESLKEWATLEVMAAALGLGRGSRLWQGLREGQASRDKASVAFETRSDFLELPGAGMVVTRMRVDPDRIDRAEAEYFREIERFRREIVSEGELQRARAIFEKHYLDTVTRFEKEAEALGRYQTQFGDCRLFDSNLQRVRAVTAQEVQQAAAKYLSLRNTTVQELEPLNARPRTFTPEKFAELAVTFENKTAQPIRPEEVKPAVALKTFPQGPERVQGAEGQNIVVAPVPMPIKDFSVLRGPRAFVREDKSQPLLSLAVFFQGGRLIEDQTTSGTTELMLRSMLKSTTTRKGELIALELESYGGDIHVVNEPDYYGFTLDLLSRNAENGLKLLIDIIENPFFDKVEVARERDALLAEQLAARDDPQARSLELMWAALYPGHPYGLPRFGLPEVVKAATDEKLEAWYAKTIKKQFPLVMLVGDTDGSALVSRIFSEGLKRGELDKTIKANLPISYNSPEEKVEPRVRPATTQAIGFRVLGTTLSGPSDHLALAMAASLATVGKVAEELRDKQGLTDEVSVVFDQRMASGAFLAQLSSLPENEQKASDALLAALQAVAASQPTDEEFEQGRNAAIGRYAIALQDHPSRAMEYARAILLGRKATDVESQPDFIRAVKKTDIKRVASNVIKPDLAGRGVVRGKIE
jgi:zinc protease